MKIGIDLGGSHIGIGLVNDNHEIVLKKDHNWTKEEKDNLIDSITNYTQNLIKEIMKEQEIHIIEKIGIGYPSKNIIDGIVYLDEKAFNLPAILKQEFQVPVYLKNDVKCSSLCEKKLGNLKDYRNCIFMTLGTGIGGAYFYQNELVKPNTYQGFEIGHMMIEINGRTCRCGRKGCFEEYASMRVFRKEIEELFKIPKVTSDKVFEIIESGEKQKEINEIIDSYVEHLSIGITNLVSIFEPDAICIGGSFAYYAPIFMDKLREKVQDNFKGRPIPDLLVAKYANDAGIIGASMLESN